jgi:hypothetical protein
VKREAPDSKGFAPKRGGGKDNEATWHSDVDPNATKFSTIARKFALILAPNLAGDKISIFRRNYQSRAFILALHLFSFGSFSC